MIILFPDDALVQNSTNIVYQQANINPSEPVLEPTFKWELPRINLYGSVVKTNNAYEMFYQCGNALRIGYAVSEDGLVWDRPMINKTELAAHPHKIVLANDQVGALDTPVLGDGQTLTNLVAGYHMPSIIHEPNNDKPYKLFAFGEEGYRVLYSVDGKQFVEYPNNPAIDLLSYKNPHTEKTWCSDVAPCFKTEQGYTAMVKTYVIDDQQRTRRCVGISTSADFEQWSEVETLWEPGDSEDEIARARGYQWADFYGLCPFPYGSGYLGFLWLFEIEKELPQGTNLGKIEVFLAYSSDAKNWRRISDEPLIPWDLNFGEEGGMVTTPSAPIFDDNDIKLYYSDSNYEHGFAEKDFTKKIADPTWVVRCAVLEKERLVGAYSGDGLIKLTALNVQHGRIRLNVACQSGSLQLEYRQAGQLIARHQVENVDKTDYWLELPVIGEIEISIALMNATLYAVELS